MDILSLAPDDRVVYRVFVPGGAEITGHGPLPLPEGTTGWVEPVFYDAHVADLDGTYRFVVQGRQLSGPQGRQWIAVQIGQTREARMAQARALFATGVAGVTAVSALGLVFVWLAIRGALRPLHRVADDLEARAPEDLSRIDASSPVEVRPLLDAINGFMVRLAQSRKLTERFMADVAHQTRTSLSTLHGHLALALDAEAPDTMRSRLAQAEQEAGRLVRLTNQLLAHAMVSHRSDRASLKPLALGPLVRETLAELMSDSRMRDVALTYTESAADTRSDVIEGDAVSIREAIRNLVDNSLRHGPPGVSLAIALECRDDTVVLSVEDDGPGIPEQERARALQPFASIASRGGSGLGLAIVAGVAEGHGGALELGEAALGGLRVEMRLPCTKRAQRGGSTAVGAAAALLIAAMSLPADARELEIWSATDTPAMAPLLERFETANPDIDISYVEFQTTDLYQVLTAAGADMPDVVISSAMDLQVDLVNRGMARRLTLPEDRLPAPWARWRSELFGFTFEPAVIIYNRAALDAATLPRNHQELAAFLLNTPGLAGRVGGYDLRASGIGYLFATQDAEQGLQAQRLLAALEQVRQRTFCCTSDMVAATARGELALAINTIGTYAAAGAKAHPNVGLHLLDDYNLVMTRTAFVPDGASSPELGERFVAFLLSDDGQAAIAETQLIPIHGDRTRDDLPNKSTGPYLPVRLGPGLLTWLDPIKRDGFLAAWDAVLGHRP